VCSTHQRRSAKEEANGWSNRLPGKASFSAASIGTTFHLLAKIALAALAILNGTVITPLGSGVTLGAHWSTRGRVST
jgi:hypothetical protein